MTENGNCKRGNELRFMQKEGGWGGLKDLG